MIGWFGVGAFVGALVMFCAWMFCAASGRASADEERCEGCSELMRALEEARRGRDLAIQMQPHICRTCSHKRAPAMRTGEWTPIYVCGITEKPTIPKGTCEHWTGALPVQPGDYRRACGVLKGKLDGESSESRIRRQREGQPARPRAEG